MALRQRSVARVLATTAAVFLGAMGLHPAAATAEPAPGSLVLPSAAPAARSLTPPDAAPEGANDWSCRPSTQHPRPVVLVHGTGMSMLQSWNVISPALRNAGYCVYALNYGAAAHSWGTGDIRGSARELASFVDTVRARTGSAQVDIVGHSQGGTMARQYLRFEGGADQVDPSRNTVRHLVMLGPTNHGTTFNGMQDLYSVFTSLRITDEPTNQKIVEFAFGLASYQQLIGSDFLTQLNTGRESFPGIDYTVIASRSDDIVTPPEGAFLAADPGTSVRNEWIQDTCPGAAVSHVGLLNDPRSVFRVQSALDPTYGARSAAPC
ncbi:MULTISPECIES: esterase/lipase family protein [unclassified Rhodococcus (in: high G+C Gram-positive bacteria)]|uniref:esterase/lipase family protein n=1 Tax=unclassified Rhodococcus (in: high G+C Gram-positive bacteria) TaxID=192944 RepID=UPI000E0AE201|nr:MULTISPECIES: alpha/beta fold hydrolase [unclassified Rhodococcus (in: high G+C Gram-positive bacteria)]QKT12787.1 alpha/beta fold hydrolase [Rhodococcus sp. W8901]RDI33957.1 triacylglycerol esterase/lipase EstA (alpha/beta hydrolase family) [Rhodococcus sp. AG1013]